jgi:hypothetical protein
MFFIERVATERVGIMPAVVRAGWGAQHIRLDPQRAASVYQDRREKKAVPPPGNLPGESVVR